MQSSGNMGSDPMRVFLAGLATTFMLALTSVAYALPNLSPP